MDESLSGVTGTEKGLDERLDDDDADSLGKDVADDSSSRECQSTWDELLKPDAHRRAKHIADNWKRPA